MSHHLVKGHMWNAIESRMVVFERYFPSFEDAKAFAENEPYEHFKIYDHQNQLVHSASTADYNTYA